MDLSDEKNFTKGMYCSSTFDTFLCDERLCYPWFTPCGDGECVMLTYLFEHSTSTDWSCANMRERNYYCEITTARQLWTMPNGMCYPFPDYDDSNDLNNPNLTQSEKCIYLVKCALSRGFERDCPCNQENCSILMKEICKQDYVIYPVGALYAPHLFHQYKIDRDWHAIVPDLARMNGCIQCRGYRVCHSMLHNITFFHQLFRAADVIACKYVQYMNNTSIIQKDKYCWNDSRTFNGYPYKIADVCNISKECISKYRLLDQAANCMDAMDEKVVDYKCDVNIRKHRFQCSSSDSKCLPVWRLGNREKDCFDNFDEFLYGSSYPLNRIDCKQSNDVGCQRLRMYISQSSSMKTNESLLNFPDEPVSSVQIPFHYFCNSYWDLSSKIDESPTYCQQWICSTGDFQCKTGQCISIDHVCDGEIDCSDGSDEQAIFVLIDHMSEHNRQLGSNLLTKIEQCHKMYDHKQPFDEFCDFQYEFPCLLNNVTDPTDLFTNRPCINLTQIGDGTANCYGALDELNTFEDCEGNMKGFGFRCNSSWALSPCKAYTHLCETRCKDRDDQPICFYRSTIGNCSAPTDVTCLNGTQCIKGGRCDGSLDCPYGEDEFWCPRTVGNFEKSHYRQIKHRNNIDRTFDLHIPFYPQLHRLPIGFQRFQTTIRTKKFGRTVLEYKSIMRDSFWCNRGVAVHVNDTIECFCPPTYYGKRCEYFSDRITVVTHLDLLHFQSDIATKNDMNVVIKIVATLRHKYNILDWHEFHVQSLIERNESVKHKFHLLYSRSQLHLKEKQKRQASRQQILHEHPYSIRFEAFELRKNQIIVELGAWHYPINFDFLPSFRFATILRFPNDYTNASIDSCRKHRCQRNSICRPLFSTKDSYYCSCKQGYYGQYCQSYNNQCLVYCSPLSICKSDYLIQSHGLEQPLCICPRDRYGPRCHLRLDSICSSDRCQNNGTCLYTYDWSGETQYHCVCQDRFYGNVCDLEKVPINIRLNTTENVRATTIQFYEINRQSFQLNIAHQAVQSGLAEFLYYKYIGEVVPPLCLLKFYDDLFSFRYFIGYFRLSVNMISITSNPLFCPKANTYIQKLNASKC
ncbi:unnamed protein product [Rotaria sp. Silwood2]|nr:unnamed protein product [Rotaria sp. Silwood2]